MFGDNLKNSEFIHTGKTYLRSTSHLVFREKKGNRLRSILVGLQYFIYYPGEIVSFSLWPFIKDIANTTFYMSKSICLLTYSTLEVLFFGLAGHLEASEEPIIVDLDEDNN